MMAPILLLLGVTTASHRAHREPPIPFVDRGACPFECCQYGEWTAIRQTRVLQRMQQDAKTAFVLAAGEKISALTGAVVTTRPGRIVVMSPTKLGTRSFQKGDLIYILHYVGE